jgi:TonB family protein
MPASFWERDAAYRKRLGVIVPFVLVAYALLFFATNQIRYEDIPRFIGWRGELEVLPEITVVPEIESVEAEPAPNERVENETVALDLTAKGDVPAQPAPQAVAEVKPHVVEAGEGKGGEGKAEIRSMDQPGRREPVSYTDHFALVKGVTPVYPTFERDQGIEGMVTVEMKVDENGMVVEANVLSTMGPDSFAESALDAVRQFVFEPPTQNGQPTTIWVRLRVKFRISG